jgi:hypothetical protein
MARASALSRRPQSVITANTLAAPCRLQNAFTSTAHEGTKSRTETGIAFSTIRLPISMSVLDHGARAAARQFAG